MFRDKFRKGFGAGWARFKGGSGGPGWLRTGGQVGTVALVVTDDRCNPLRT